MASVPKIQGLLAEAREKGMAVVYSLTRNATAADIRNELTPRAGEPVVKAGVARET